MISSFCKWGLLGHAIENKILTVEVLDPRDQTMDLHHRVDDKPFGGGDGMVMMAEPLFKTVVACGTISAIDTNYVIYLTPQGTPLNDKKVKELAQKKHISLICGRYAGVDQRLINQAVDEEISIGDFVLSGGEVAAQALIEAVSRQLPGVIGDQKSVEQDSFANGWLEAPQFTKPRLYNDEEIPEDLLSGHHENIKKWQILTAKLVTLKKRPDMFVCKKQTAKEVQELKNFWQKMSVTEKNILDLDFDFDHELELALKKMGT
jgi:tRNA (guanine37-N1)-methyltransferase